MCETPLLFEPTLTKRDSYIAYAMSDLSLWQAAHMLRTPNLAEARRQIEGNGIPDHKENFSEPF